jgi:Putative MetA-pathway of phenol degradation
MQRVARLFSVFFMIVGATLCVAQGPCPTQSSTQTTTIPTRSGKLICLVPQVYGPGGLVGVDHGGPLLSTALFSHAAHFTNSALQSLVPLNAEIGTQISQLPITSPVSGFVFSFNPSLGVVSRQTEGFGPVLTERPETIGKHKIFVGFAYQYFNFDKADGVNLKNFGAVFQHEEEPELCTPGSPITCVNGEPTFQKDVISMQNRLDLKVHQFVGVATVGVTDRFDLSVAIPILQVRSSFNSSGTIDSFETSADFPPCCLHQFDPSSSQIPNHETFFASNSANFFDGKSASGIGDIVIRGKYEILKGEKAGLAVGADLHLPTGDEQNFLGSGTWGVRPFVTVSYSGRISPHGTFGYQRNGSSVLSGDITNDTKSHLPDALTYSAGVDVGVNHRLSVTADYIGQSLINSKRMSNVTFVDVAGNPHADLTSTTSTINQAYISVGGKLNPVGKLLVVANVLFQVNEAGLHSKPVPLIGLSYTF